MNIKAEADRLALKYGTRDPFTIAREMDCVVLFVPMTGLRGFYRYMKRCHMIYINDSLDEVQSKLVCAHELGHLILHKGVNRLFMDNSTLLVSGRFENDANRFASALVYSDDELIPYLSRPLSDAAAYMGISEDTARYRLSVAAPPQVFED